MIKQLAYVINLDKRTDRWIQMQKLWSPWFELVRVSAADGLGGDGAAACKLSHLLVWERAISYPAIVLEDDAVPTPWFEKIGMRCIEEARKYLNCWSICNCGPFLDLRTTCARLEESPSPYWLRSSFTLQTHFMLYNHRSCDLLRRAIQQPLPLDVYLGRQAGQLVSARLLATQAAGPSDIGQSPKNQDYYYRLSERLLEQHTPKLP